MKVLFAFLVVLTIAWAFGLAWGAVWLLSKAVT